MSKFISMAMVVAIAGSLSAAAARAQSSVPRYYGAVTPTAYDNIEYYSEADDKSPSDKAPMPATPGAPAPAAAAPAAPATDSGAACTSCGGGSCGCQDYCKLTCPDQTIKRLFGDCCWLKCHDITVQGWGEAGYAWHDGTRNPDGFNGPDGFNDRDGEFLLDQLYVTAQKALKDNDCCWDWGFQVDFFFGSDYRYPLEKGLDARDDGTPRWHTDDRRLYGFNLPQAYLQFGTKALYYKVGEMYTYMGNEVVAPVGNVFYSHTYTFLYAIPFTHTGVSATYVPNDQLTISNMIIEGWDTFNDTDENPGYMGQVIFTAKDKHTVLTIDWIDSMEPIVSGGNPNPPDGVNAHHNRFVITPVLSHDLNDRLSYEIDGTWGCQAAGEAEGDTSTWGGVASIQTYKLNCCWTAGMREEWFRDTDGTRVAPVGDFATPVNNNVASAGGFAGNFNDWTWGLNYHPNANVQFRPEIRYDWYDGQRNVAGNLPYRAGTSNHQWIYSTDMIWQY
jgi:hypothetical protein